MKHSPYPTSDPTHCSFYLNPPLNSISFFSAKPPPTAHILFPTPLVAPYKALKRSVTLSQWSHRCQYQRFIFTQITAGHRFQLYAGLKWLSNSKLKSHSINFKNRKNIFSSCHSLPAESYMFSSYWLCALYSVLYILYEDCFLCDCRTIREMSLVSQLNHINSAYHPDVERCLGAFHKFYCK